ncbi:MAG: 2OG-Fe(II) oxygenase [Gammaproteobacteria bacterium]|nr:2OG-Fe(II) oxygenase [Gammaproteobacteria bacterium]MBT4462399.1 2OG-Fe(II) oxygenase [Gammaproteobacteria bacterium]MBT4655326.1 2OG-Fe(II) oxygenase [Gammaproteobacteria bacterium]MBT5117252.1 2OG-Fe(II) oxygenase [Gammaproteobacteria bacterium]MBT5762141.1 2OG-Fe(II) oxygenase [Gammaproteobacteria bacterium]
MDIQLDKRLIEVKPNSFIFEFSNSISSEDCLDIINRFEDSEEDHYQGRVGQTFEENLDIKKSTDMVVSGKENWKDVDDLLFTSLAKALSGVKKQFDFFTGPFKDIGYAVQRTKPGEFFHWHIDSGSHQFSDRQMVAIWYLNDVIGPGGETEFLHQNVKIKPEAGKLILFPPFWTHEHRGVTLKKDIKYIATTWIVFK